MGTYPFRFIEKISLKIISGISLNQLNPRSYFFFLVFQQALFNFTLTD